jgi:hypothetical protein
MRAFGLNDDELLRVIMTNPAAIVGRTDLFRRIQLGRGRCRALFLPRESRLNVCSQIASGRKYACYELLRQSDLFGPVHRFGNSHRDAFRRQE